MKDISVILLVFWLIFITGAVWFWTYAPDSPTVVDDVQGYQLKKVMEELEEE